MTKKQPPNNVTDIINTRKNKAAMSAGYWQLLARIMMLGIVAYLIFTQLFFITRVDGNPMFPAIKDGDIVIGYRLQATYLKDEVVSYTVDGEQHLGRVLGRASDVITIDDTGTLLVNGTAQGGDIAFATYAEDTSIYPFQVPEDTIFVLGDYRTQTLDSRDFGPIPTEDVEGKIISLFRRRGI